MKLSSARGFAYAEVLIAAVILALCAVPAADAIRNGIDAGRVGQSKAAELRCVRNQMDTVLAEPYVKLRNQITVTGNGTNTFTYTIDADASCDVRTVVLTLKQFDGANLLDLAATASDTQKQTALVKIQVSLQNSDYGFSSVVAP
jgi:Tfp pilus assembly protein PilE